MTPSPRVRYESDKAREIDRMLAEVEEHEKEINRLLAAVGRLEMTTFEDAVAEHAIDLERDNG